MLVIGRLALVVTVGTGCAGTIHSTYDSTLRRTTVLLEAETAEGGELAMGGSFSYPGREPMSSRSVTVFFEILPGTIFLKGGQPIPDLTIVDGAERMVLGCKGRSTLWGPATIVPCARSGARFAYAVGARDFQRLVKTGFSGELGSMPFSASGRSLRGLRRLASLVDHPPRADVDGETGEIPTPTTDSATAATAPGSLPDDVALSPINLVVVRSRIEYFQHSRWADGRREDFAYRESWRVMRTDGDQRTYEIEIKDLRGTSDDTTTTLTAILSKQGLALIGGKDRLSTWEYPAPKVVIPAHPESSATWVAPRWDGVVETTTLKVPSPFCPDGIVVARAWQTAAGVENLMSDHYCRGVGWRGQEVVARKDGQVIGVHWTSEVRVANTLLEDSPLHDRLAADALGLATR